ncbi:hypothetical protein WJX81_002777 [Elliptochloris bilobata]|uniref:non-specific serine/threonine protein kinase n=1 Tax=Elliptochloris bilobata TaxID=381761 RepID=A0AAW1S878_9CHLO
MQSSRPDARPWWRALEALCGAPLPEAAVRAVAANVAVALAELHADGLVHRVLGPDAIVLGEGACFDTARLADGGCMAVLDVFGTFTDKARLGLPALLAPELVQARRGAALAYTPATDMWALGALLWALLTGAPPPAAAWLASVAGAGVSVEDMQAGLDVCMQRELAALLPAARPSSSALGAVAALMRVDPAQRLDAPALLRQPWLLRGGSGASTDASLLGWGACEASHAAAWGDDAAGAPRLEAGFPGHARAAASCPLLECIFHHA